jgi:FdhE protein
MFIAAFGALAAAPVLAALGRRLAARVPAGWRECYCPVCAAWPALAELRGVEGGRYLRCGRCAAGWEVEWLRCTYCDTIDHQQLGSLEPEPEGDRRKADTCAVCRGYLKAIPTLVALAPQAILLEDLASVDLDVAAIERGYGRPGPPPRAPLDVLVVPHPGGGLKAVL